MSRTNVIWGGQDWARTELFDISVDAVIGLVQSRL